MQTVNGVLSPAVDQQVQQQQQQVEILENRSLFSVFSFVRGVHTK